MIMTVLDNDDDEDATHTTHKMAELQSSKSQHMTQQASFVFLLALEEEVEEEREYPWLIGDVCVSVSCVISI